MNVEQLSHHESQPQEDHSLHIILVGCDIDSPANAGSLLRLADAFTIRTVVFCGKPVDLSSNRLKRTARNTDKVVNIVQTRETLDQLKFLKEQKYYLVGLEITSGSTALHQYSCPGKRIALVVGNERRGIADDVLNFLDDTVHITMYGKNSSMNVSHAAAIALYHFTKP